MILLLLLCSKCSWLSVYICIGLWENRGGSWLGNAPTLVVHHAALGHDLDRRLDNAPTLVVSPSIWAGPGWVVHQRAPISWWPPYLCFILDQLQTAIWMSLWLVFFLEPFREPLLQPIGIYTVCTCTAKLVIIFYFTVLSNVLFALWF